MPRKTCLFSIEFSGEAEALAARARQAIVGAGGQFEGDATEGTFALSTPMGRVEGHYRIGGQAVHVELTKKPRVVPCQRIETMLTAYLAA